jgi:hypothetical protein
MASIRRLFRFGLSLAIILLLAVVFVLGLAVQTLLRVVRERVPAVQGFGETLRNWIRRPL